MRTAKDIVARFQAKNPGLPDEAAWLTAYHVVAGRDPRKTYSAEVRDSLVPNPGEPISEAVERTRMASILGLVRSDPVVDQLFDAALEAFAFPESMWFREVKWAGMKEGELLDFPPEPRHNATRIWYGHRLLDVAADTSVERKRRDLAALATACLVVASSHVVRTSLRRRLHEAAATTGDHARLLMQIADLGGTSADVQQLRTAIQERRDQKRHTARQPTRRKDMGTILAQAKGLLVENPTWTNARLAKQLGIRRETLSRSPYKQQMKRLRDTLRGFDEELRKESDDRAIGNAERSSMHHL